MAPRLPALLLMLPLALAACGNTPAAPRAAAPRPAGVPAARTVVPLLDAGGLVDAAGLERPIDLPEGGEGLADLRLAVPGSDWETPGREAVTVRLSIDGTPNQDVVLYAGAAAHTYQVALGALAAGAHTLRFERVEAFSAPALGDVQLLGGTVGVVAPGQPGYETLARSPIVLSREAPHLTDTPLLMMVEEAMRPEGGTATKYTAIYSNEDGGTATPALMARWGRTADVDWCYAFETDPAGRTVKETYQGMLHFTRDFKGRYEGRHPILRTSTNNNCYDDGGEGPLKFRLPPLFRLEPSQTAREEVLDRNPWAYGIMAKELFRERKALRDGEARGGAIGDPRRFVFAEFKQTYRGRGLGIAVTLKGQARPYTSHKGDGGLTAQRSGWVRVAAELPRAITLADVQAIDVEGPGRGTSIVQGVRRVFTLDADFRPVILPVTWTGEATLASEKDRVRAYEAPLAPADPL